MNTSTEAEREQCGTAFGFSVFDLNPWEWPPRQGSADSWVKTHHET